MVGHVEHLGARQGDGPSVAVRDLGEVGGEGPGLGHVGLVGDGRGGTRRGGGQPGGAHGAQRADQYDPGG
jgi:hypothetical protein